MANEVFSGRDAVVEIDNASNVLTDISINVAELSVESDTEQVPYTTLARPKRVKVAGYSEEDWTIRGPYNPESEAFWRPLAGTTAGKGVDFQVGPFGKANGLLRWTGTANVIHFESTGINPDGIEEYEARLSILTKTIGTFSGL